MASGFFVIEGLDGAGKTSVIAEVKKLLLRGGFPASKIVVTAEPTDSAFGHRIRHLLSSKKGIKSNAAEFLELYVLDRRHHLKSVILPALFDGKIVLCDRYKYSTLVYQSLQGIDPEKIARMHAGMLKPDAVFVLDIDEGTALERISSSKRGKTELFEKKVFLKKARKKFLSMEKFFPGEKIIVVDASRPLGEVAQKIFSFLEKSA
ncbi:MAG: dTMP kinase [Candidatus Diapherotrites archaeon]|nr:dTMP kinase [Candidatus Diapherotrites archaeon]